MENNYGQLSRDDIINELNSNKGFKIFIGDGLDDTVQKHIKYSSYDITPSIVALSSKTGMLEKVYKNKSPLINSYYIYVKPKDTVLIVSNECVCLPNYISGYVTSRVSNVVHGFGHISTTIDPTWSGGLLIALSNPSNRAIKIEVGISSVENESGELEDIKTSQTLATLTFHYLHSVYTGDVIEYKSMRIDLLKKIEYRKRKGIRALLRKCFYRKRCKFTDYFFEYIKILDNITEPEKSWNKFIEEFGFVYNKQAENKSAYDFVVKENVFNKMKHFYINHKGSIWVFIILLIISILFLCGIINKDLFELIMIFIK